MPLPSYDQYVKVEAAQTLAAYCDAHGHDPAWSDQAHTAWRRLVEGWTHEAILRDIYAGAGKPFPGTPQPVPPGPVTPSTLRGRLRADGKLFRAGDGGRFVWRFCSGFVLAHLFATDRPKADAYLDWVQSTGFNGVRVLCGQIGWAGQTFDSALRGLPALLEDLARRGLYAELTVLTGTKDIAKSKAEAHVLSVGVLAGSVEHAVVELANEVGHSSQADWLTPEWGRTFGKRLSVPWAVGAPLGSDEPTPEGTFDGSGGTYITSHLSRSRDFWNQVRRVRELYAIVTALKAPVVNNEPIGAGPVRIEGKRETNPVFFKAMGALNSLFGIQGVFHLDAGLLCTVPSVIETTCGKAFLDGHTVMGDEAGTLQYQNVGFVGSPVKSITNLVRAYSFIGGSTGYTIGLGSSASSRVEWGNGWRPSDRMVDEGGLTIWRIAK